MKKLFTVISIFVLALGLFTGCFGRRNNETTAPATTRPTSAPTTRPSTHPATEPTMPSMEDMIPGTEDTVDPDAGENGETIDPTNGANDSEGNARRKNSPKF